MNEHKSHRDEDGSAQGHSGESRVPPAARVEDEDMDSLNPDDRQDVLVDEAVEETFPASDPISPKRIT